MEAKVQKVMVVTSRMLDYKVSGMSRPLRGVYLQGSCMQLKALFAPSVCVSVSSCERAGDEYTLLSASLFALCPRWPRVLVRCKEAMKALDGAVSTHA